MKPVLLKITVFVLSSRDESVVIKPWKREETKKLVQFCLNIYGLKQIC